MSNFEVNLPATLEYNGVVMNLESESSDRIANAVAYLLPYAFGKSLQDSVAGVKKALAAYKADYAGLKESERKSAEALVKPLIDTYGEEVCKGDSDEVIKSEMAARAEAIFAGTIGARGPRLTGEAAIRRDVIDRFFNSWAKARSDAGKGVLPSLKSMFDVTAKAATDEQKKAVADAIAELKAKFAATPNNSAKIEEEVKRQLALQEEVELDLDLDI